MKSVQLRDAKAGLSTLVDAAERGEQTTITRHGKPAAVLVSVSDAARLQAMADDKPTLAELLLAYPGGLELERDERPMRDVDL